MLVSNTHVMSGNNVRVRVTREEPKPPNRGLGGAETEIFEVSGLDLGVFQELAPGYK